MKNVKLIVSDLDGTLLNSNGELSKETIDALHGAKNRGYKIVFASGRGDTGILKVIEQAGLASDIEYIVSFNGSKITKLKDMTVTHKFYTESDLLNKVTSFIDSFNEAELINKRLSHLTCYGVGDTCIYSDYKCYYAADEAQKNDLEIVDSKDEHATYKVVVAGDSKVLDLVIDSLKRSFGKNYTVLRSADTNIDIVHNKAGKAGACKFILEDLNLNQVNLMTFGDSGNDADMLKYANIGVAMGNGSKEAILNANIVTDTNDEHGVANILNQL